MAVIQTQPITQRDPGPYRPKRRCTRCTAYLRTTNPGPRCDPCGAGENTPHAADVLLRELMEAR